MNVFSPPQLSRRHFLLTASAGLSAATFGFSVTEAPASEPGSEINAWVVINPDDSIIIRFARAEMGQGNLTGLVQLVAEELDCDWSKVSYELIQPAESLKRNNAWGKLWTGGSVSIRTSQDYVRKGGATARAMLIAAAAREWGVDVVSCSASKSIITHIPTGRTVTYGVVAQRAAALSPPTDVPLKDPKDWRIAGQSLLRLDADRKLDGSLVYGMDLKIPGMLVALPMACPVPGGTLKSLDASAAKSLPGIRQVLEIDGSVAVVVGETFWQAKTALDALVVEWNGGEHATASSETIREFVRSGLEGKATFVDTERGDAVGNLAAAANVIEREYDYPYLTHAPMESLSAIVRWSEKDCEVWAPTQAAESAMAAISAASGHPVPQCELHTMLIGGSFGRRLMVDYIELAVKIARKIPDVPVKMMWTREEDMAQGRYHPITQCRLRAALNSEGMITAMHMRIAGQSIMASTAPDLVAKGEEPIAFQGLKAEGPEGSLGYTIPSLLVDFGMRNPHLKPGLWRGVNLNHNAMYLECFIDELAQAAKIDPLAFRRKHMQNHPLHWAVLEEVANEIGWEKAPAAGIHRGIAQIMGFGSYVAAAAEVSVQDGRLRIHRIVAATNPGHVVNPQQVEAQVAGSFSYGLGALLHGGLTVKDGRIEQTNFDTYNVTRLADMPEVKVLIRPTGGFWGGVGEPTIAVAVPAVLNAIAAGTGKRVRSLPVKLAELGI
ncbi:xanthine dehydrogenase family protein molybdopterin-binding subunit [Agrobacterium genomosp. 3]|jgi:isoquinoline 1-oxidoreductase beta subunit|uniref:xanthine dehydrogenase family protein molybdopterin-binding subunit n=1 Tax=Agrobacterium TaxID=357 RepID=UPI001CD8AEC6|nr:molybdopterin cofactor-binding domain-containing protein [Agrobacterium pusense]MCA1867944.1 xanthine dehydrogenase family protein molybdopterin-binding subunit [Agrobacterium tomkonis]MCA1878363.1 xanthine dehydrogenase family protein molybdopterin-binding subunit [Agrobacterium tumefaciens]MCA1893519.1 xanthine dehydrogenase family protein molybdopterin-binding subunit [Agrobacterium tomkonis]MDH0117051.1 molybdopterin-dependent oxidoreductase [Agrobacterium pusense]MDH0872577.1 molybdopt